MIVLNPGALRVLELRLLMPYQGVWLADVEIDPQSVASAPSAGKVTVTIGPDASTEGAVTIQGTVDPRGSGSFVSLSHLRVLGGAAGWDQPVSRQHFHADAGLTTAGVYGPTGALVGETVLVKSPTPIVDFVRSMGPARRVLDREPSWWVDPVTGTTFVAARPAAVADPSLNLVFWDAGEELATLTCDALVYPGTALADPRFNGASPVVRDVEQTFGAHGSTVKAWCGAAPAAALANDLRSLVTELSGVRYARTYRYRVVAQAADGRLQLQAVNPAAGMPDQVSIQPRWGLPGAAAKVTPGTSVALRFLEGDPTLPVVDLYDGTTPIVLDLPATSALNLAGGATPVVPAPWATGLAAALATFASAMAAAATGPLAPMAAPASALGTALAALPPEATTIVKAT